MTFGMPFSVLRPLKLNCDRKKKKRAQMIFEVVVQYLTET